MVAVACPRPDWRSAPRRPREWDLRQYGAQAVIEPAHYFFGVVVDNDPARPPIVRYGHRPLVSAFAGVL